MSYMGEIVILIEDARAHGVTLTVSDFSTNDAGQLTIDGMTTDDWFAAMVETEGTVTVQLPSLNAEFDAETEWAAWLELTYDPDNGTIDRLEDLI